MSNARKIRSDVTKLSCLSVNQPSFYFIHGFIVGLGSMPELIQFSEWHPKLFGGFEFENEQQMKLADSLMQLYNNLMQDCMDVDVKLPNQCKLSTSDTAASVQPDQPLPQWCLGLLSSFNLIDVSTLDVGQLGTLRFVEQRVLAFTSYANLRAATRSPLDDWQKRALTLRRDLTLHIARLIDIVRFGTEENDDLFGELPDFPDFNEEGEYDSELEFMDEFEAAIEMALYEDSAEAHQSLDILIKGFEESQGEAYFQENAGHFWLMHETRPYMMMRARRANVNYQKGKHSEAIAEMQALLHLNPNDNQANRYILTNWLVIARDWQSVSELTKEYDESSVPMLAAKALMLYANEQNSLAANKAKKDLIQANKHLVKYLTGQKKVKSPPEFYQPGEASEVEVYLEIGGKEAWRSVDGALFWLRQK